METSLRVALVLTNVINEALLPSQVTSLSECLHNCFHSITCATFFYDRVQMKCYPSEDLCSTPSQQLTARNGVACYEWKHGACQENWSYHKPTGLCLQLHQTKMTQPEAEENCNNHGGRLVNIHSSLENRIVKNLVEIVGNGLWIGLKKTSGTWKWNSDTDLSQFGFWSDGHPQSGRDCVVMSRKDFQWYTYSCSRKRKSLCEIIPIILKCSL